MPKKKNINIVVIGDGGVGKTSVLFVYKEKKFPDEYCPTVFDNYNCKITVDGETVELSLHDTAGQEEYKGLRTLAYMNADVIIVCFSLVDRNTFDNVKSIWIPEIKKNCKKRKPKILLCGTKMDLKRNKNYKQEMEKMGITSVENSEAESLCDELKLESFVPCSAKTNENVSRIMNEAVCYVLAKKKRCTIQ